MWYIFIYSDAFHEFNKFILGLFFMIVLDAPLMPNPKSGYFTGFSRPHLLDHAISSCKASVLHSQCLFV